MGALDTGRRSRASGGRRRPARRWPHAPVGLCSEPGPFPNRIFRAKPKFMKQRPCPVVLLCGPFRPSSSLYLDGDANHRSKMMPIGGAKGSESDRPGWHSMAGQTGAWWSTSSPRQPSPLPGRLTATPHSNPGSTREPGNARHLPSEAKGTAQSTGRPYSAKYLPIFLEALLNLLLVPQ